MGTVRRSRNFYAARTHRSRAIAPRLDALLPLLLTYRFRVLTY